MVFTALRWRKGWHYFRTCAIGRRRRGEDDVRGLTLSSAGGRREKRKKTPCEDDVGVLTLSSAGGRREKRR